MCRTHTVADSWECRTVITGSLASLTQHRTTSTIASPVLSQFLWPTMQSPEKQQKAIDLSHHLSDVALARQTSPLKGLARFFGRPGMISLAGGTDRLPTRWAGQKNTHACLFVVS